MRIFQVRNPLSVWLTEGRWSYPGTCLCVNHIHRATDDFSSTMKVGKWLYNPYYVGVTENSNKNKVND